MARLRQVVGICFATWGGVRVVVDLVSSLDATRNYAQFAYLQLGAAPASRSLTIAVVVIGLVLLVYEPLIRFWQRVPTQSSDNSTLADGRAAPDPDAPCFSFEAPDEIHSYTPLDLFIRNCGRTARGITFDPLISKTGRHAIRLDRIPSLGRDQLHPLTFQAGADESWLIKGVVNHLILFFDDNPGRDSRLSYTLTVRFLDGKRPMMEQHIFEGEPLPRGGIKLRMCPVVSRGAAPLDEKQKQKTAKEAIGRLLEQLAQCEREAYDGSNSSDYDRLLGQIEQIKRNVKEIAAKYLDSSFESRFLAVNVLDVQLDEATKMHFIARAQGSFWTMYQQLKGWRQCLVGILQELGR